VERLIIECAEFSDWCTSHPRWIAALKLALNADAAAPQWPRFGRAGISCLIPERHWFSRTLEEVVLIGDCEIRDEQTVIHLYSDAGPLHAGS
jgi:hypothetical protein